MAVQVAVCGPSECTDTERQRARRVGELLADRGAVVLCGGGPGAMAAVTEGALHRGGTVVAIRPDDGRGSRTADPRSITITSNLGQARNAVLVWSADAVIAVGGSWGTVSEIALAARRGSVPVIVLGGWSVVDDDGRPVPGVTRATGPEDAVDAALAGIG